MRPPAWTLPASPSMTNVLEAPAVSIVHVVEANSRVEEAVGSPSASSVTVSLPTASQAKPLEAEEEAIKTRPFVPTAKSNQSVPSETMRSPLVGVVEAMSRSSSSYACTSVPMVRPRLPMAVVVAAKSERLFAATSKVRVRSVLVPEKLVIASPGTMSCPVKSVVVPEKLAMVSPGSMTVPVKSVAVPDTCLMSMVPTLITPLQR